MSCQVEQIADCGDISSIARALFVAEREDENWLSQCQTSLSPCGNLLAIGYKNRLCLLTSQWISSTNSNTYLISWSGTLPSDITNVLVLSICPSHHSSQNGPDWFCIIVGFYNGSVGFYTNTGHLLLMERLEEKPVMKVACHTGTYGTLPDDIHVVYQSCVCVVSGSSLFQTLRVAKAHLAKVQAGIHSEYTVDNRSINIRKWSFTDQDTINDAAVVGLELKNSYDHLLAASTYGGYDTWYRSIPPMNTLILAAGVSPYIGFHYALEGGTTPPLQDVARAVANKIKSALPGWLGGSSSVDNSSTQADSQLRGEPLSMRRGMFDSPREGASVAVSPDKRLAAFSDNLGRVAVFDVAKGYIIKLFKGYRDAQCAFVQIFDDDKKKPQLSMIKEIKRALFLIIYNPKKGLIDIRLMQRGNRIAVFTATKNGMLLYNTCGLVGADKDYTHKKLNLPEFQSVLLDPDGKIKKFNIPFFYALDGKHLERSKDLHTLRDLRDYIKKNAGAEDFESEILEKAAAIKTLELKKHCLEMLIRNYEVSPSIVMSCLKIFWDSLHEEESEEKELIQTYFTNLALVTLFYRYIQNEDDSDMRELIDNVRQTIPVAEMTKDLEQNDLEFHLLEDDSCILERLLILAQENGYKHKHARVTFADNKANSYKEFISCFQLEEKSEYLAIKPDLSQDKLNNLSSNVFTAMFKTANVKNLGRYTRFSNMDPKEIVKLLIMNLMHMELEEISIEVIESFIAILYYISRVSKSATHITYNEISPWWEDIRCLLADMSCPLRSMVVAMSCKAVCRLFELQHCDGDDAWESVTKEYAKWGILIGKLEDISILSIILLFKDTFKGSTLPKLQVSNISINLKYIYTRGKGSITELISKWLCAMGIPPEAVIVNELLDSQNDPNQTDEQQDESPDFLFIENNRAYVDNNPKIFKWLSLLRQQFPLSTISDYIIANMCWEYAMAWQNNINKCHKLNAVLRCLKNISNLHLRLGLFSIIWSTYIKQVFESTCRLVNKVGKLPKDPLCLQDIGFTGEDMVKFLEITTQYLEFFLQCAATSIDTEQTTVQYEKIWEESLPSLVEVAQETKNVNDDILNLNYQVSCTIYYQCHYNIKVTKPLDTLYDIDYQYIIEALAGNVVKREINMRASEKIRNPRLKFLTKLIRASLETITCKQSEGPFKVYSNEECELWMERITNLANQWGVDNDFIIRQQLIGLYHLGYDTLAENIISLVKQPELLLAPIVAMTIQRLKRNLEQCPNPPEWIVSVPPHMYKRMQNVALDTSIPAHPSLQTTTIVLQNILHQIDKRCKNPQAITQDMKVAELMIETCEVLMKRKF